uniref:Uncharacterized protein n=1 Tax=Anguilla anguilla TaxID=7936 RepID=A0A0E9TGP1_ANGAN
MLSWNTSKPIFPKACNNSVNLLRVLF